MYVYDAAWLALAVVLTVCLVAVTAWTWRNRGWRPAMFAAGLTLLPMAAHLTGTLRLVGVIVDQVAGYFTGFVFRPTVWLGVALGVAGIGLMLAATALKRRGIGTSAPPSPDNQTASSRPTRRATPPDRLTATTPTRHASREAGANEPDDLDDIEAILRKHGIQ